MACVGPEGPFAAVTERLEVLVGRIPIVGRYHRLPRTLTDDYDLSDEILGVGDSGTVFRATRKGSTSGRSFAVKTYALEAIESLKLQMLLSEVETFLYVDHPHIARLFGIYETDKQLHFVMESIEGGQLFERFKKIGRFPEAEAADAVCQILLALNYIHQHGIVHRDVKLENFVYDKRGSSNLKLIDFGFSKMFNAKMKMKKAFGTMLYVAPEVLKKSYTCQCDIWSLGVMAFVLLADHFPFAGDCMEEKILAGKYDWRPHQWCKLSEGAADFVRSLLRVNPQERLTAQAALDHPWIAGRRIQSRVEGVVGREVAEALVAFGRTSKFRRCCMEMLAWSLSADDRAKVHDEFLSMDTNGRGSITLTQLKATMKATLNLPEQEVERAFAVLDANNDHEINYSEFLAAMVSTRIDLQASPVESVFRKFDRDRSGYITANGLRAILGHSYQGNQAEELIDEADLDKDGRLSFNEFCSYLQNSAAPAAAAEPKPPCSHRGQRPSGVLRLATFFLGAMQSMPFRCCVRPAPVREPGPPP